VDSGSVCEELAVLKMSHFYDKNRYDIESGILYTDGSGKLLGEIDLAVIRKDDKEVKLVGEVKCRKNTIRAKSHAESQLTRLKGFLESQQSSKLDFFLSSHREIHFKPEQFLGSLKYVTISQKGGAESGFDMELGITLSEVRILHKMLNQ
jgi:hypothetical protein